MTDRCRRAGLFSVAWLLTVGSPVAAQATGALVVGASVIEYEGFLRSAAAVLAPSFQIETPRLTVAGQGSWTVFESGSQVGQAAAAIGWLTGSRRWWRLELSGSAGVAKYAADPMSGQMLGGARLHVFGARTGGWIGLTTGGVFDQGTALAPFELTMAGWHVRQGLTVVAAATATRVGPERFVDLLGTVRWASPAVEFEARIGARPWTRAQGDQRPGGYGDVTALFPLSPRLAVSVGGGNHLADPVRRSLGAKYLTAGIRLRTVARPSAAAFPGSAAIMRRLTPTDAGAGRLELAGSGATRVVRVHVVGVAAVELMADFTDWAVVSLLPTAPGVFELALPMSPGVYRFNLRLDGGPWTVPAGTRLERTEFGAVGVIIVPGPPN